jgi:hypothetical protein
MMKKYIVLLVLLLTVFIVSIVLSESNAGAFLLPDTGQIFCYDSTSRMLLVRLPGKTETILRVRCLSPITTRSPGLYKPSRQMYVFTIRLG